MHTNKILICTQNNQQIYIKAGGGAGLLHAPYAGSYLPFLKPNTLLVGTYTTLFSKETNGYTLPGNDAKILSDKKVSFSPYLPYINYQSRHDFLSQECT